MRTIRLTEDQAKRASDSLIQISLAMARGSVLPELRIVHRSPFAVLAYVLRNLVFAGLLLTTMPLMYLGLIREDFESVAIIVNYVFWPMRFMIDYLDPNSGVLEFLGILLLMTVMIILGTILPLYLLWRWSNYGTVTYQFSYETYHGNLEVIRTKFHSYLIIVVANQLQWSTEVRGSHVAINLTGREDVVREWSDWLTTEMHDRLMLNNSVEHREENYKDETPDEWTRDGLVISSRPGFSERKMPLVEMGLLLLNLLVMIVAAFKIGDIYITALFLGVVVMAVIRIRYPAGLSRMRIKIGYRYAEHRYYQNLYLQMKLRVLLGLKEFSNQRVFAKQDRIYHFPDFEGMEPRYFSRDVPANHWFILRIDVPRKQAIEIADYIFQQVRRLEVPTRLTFLEKELSLTEDDEIMAFEDLVDLEKTDSSSSKLPVSNRIFNVVMLSFILMVVLMFVPVTAPEAINGQLDMIYHHDQGPVVFEYTAPENSRYQVLFSTFNASSTYVVYNFTYYLNGILLSKHKTDGWNLTNISPGDFRYEAEDCIMLRGDHLRMESNSSLPVQFEIYVNQTFSIEYSMFFFSPLFFLITGVVVVYIPSVLPKRFREYGLMPPIYIEHFGIGSKEVDEDRCPVMTRANIAVLLLGLILMQAVWLPLPPFQAGRFIGLTRGAFLSPLILYGVPVLTLNWLRHRIHHRFTKLITQVLQLIVFVTGMVLYPGVIDYITYIVRQLLEGKYVDIW